MQIGGPHLDSQYPCKTLDVVKVACDQTADAPVTIMAEHSGWNYFEPQVQGEILSPEVTLTATGEDT